LIATAALELSTNQITHVLLGKEEHVEMIRLLELLITQYRGQIASSSRGMRRHGMHQKKFFGR